MAWRLAVAEAPLPGQEQVVLVGSAWGGVHAFSLRSEGVVRYTGGPWGGAKGEVEGSDADACDARTKHGLRSSRQCRARGVRACATQLPTP